MKVLGRIAYDRHKCLNTNNWQLPSLFHKCVSIGCKMVPQPSFILERHRWGQTDLPLFTKFYKCLEVTSSVGLGQDAHEWAYCPTGLQKIITQ